MKTQQKIYFCVLALVLVAPNAVAQGTLALHNGSTDPTLEGWTRYTDFGAPQCSALTNDLGKNSWSVLLSNAGGGYSKNLPDISSQDWVLSCNLRLVTPNQPVGSAFALAIGTGTRGFGLLLGSDSNDNLQLQLGGSPNSTYILHGQGTAYNSLQLVYGRATGQASLWANGSLLGSAIPGFSLNLQPSIAWGGDVQTANSYQANWNLMSLQIIPEPSSFSLLWLGGVLFSLRHRSFQHAAGGECLTARAWAG